MLVQPGVLCGPGPEAPKWRCPVPIAVDVWDNQEVGISWIYLMSLTRMEAAGKMRVVGLHNSLECARHLQRNSLKSLIRASWATLWQQSRKGGSWFWSTRECLAKASASHSAAHSPNPSQGFFPPQAPILSIFLVLWAEGWCPWMLP